MAVNNRLILQATCLLILVLHSTWHAAEATKYCDGDFHLAVYRTCSTHKRSGGEPVFSLDDVLSMNRLRNNVRRSADSALQDEAFFMTSLQKRSEYNGIASYCCLHGCTPAELSVVC